MASHRDGGKSPEILYAPVGASTKEYIVDRLALQKLASLESHVINGFLEIGITLIGNRFGDADAHAGVGSISDAGFNIFSLE